MHTPGTAILGRFVCTGPLRAQTSTRHRASPAFRTVAEAGGHQLTERMLEQAVRLGEILAESDFSPSDAGRLRSDLIALYRLYRAEAFHAITHATGVNLDVMGLGRAGRSTAKSADIDTAMAQR